MSNLEFSLGKNCGLTLVGLKTASLFRLNKSDAEDLGFYAECFGKKDVCFEILKDDGQSYLLYVYKKKKLKEHLLREETKRFLGEFGYFYETAEEAISRLKERLKNRDFPHEIGVFLDYDLEDVRQFILHPNEGVLLNGCWKVYGDVERKAELFRKYEKCVNCIRKKLTEDQPLVKIFNVI